MSEPERPAIALERDRAGLPVSVVLEPESRSRRFAPKNHKSRCTEICTAALEVETAGIEPASATAQRSASTSVAGALYLAPHSLHRRGCEGPAQSRCPFRRLRRASGR